MAEAQVSVEEVRRIVYETKTMLLGLSRELGDSLEDHE